jgi:hypothetical protein
VVLDLVPESLRISDGHRISTPLLLPYKAGDYRSGSYWPHAFFGVLSFPSSAEADLGSAVFSLIDPP